MRHMISEKSVRQYCKDDISTIENYSKAIDDKTQIWHLHHRREIEENKSSQELKNERLYFNRPSCELIFLTNSQHTILHMKNMRRETRLKKSKARKSNGNWRLGWKWFNNGVEEIMAKECPEGFVQGRLKTPQYMVYDGK